MTEWRFCRMRNGLWYWMQVMPAGVKRGASFPTRSHCIEDAIANHGLRVQDTWHVPGRERVKIVDAPHCESLAGGTVR
jgi:hypothetical protein